MVLPPDPEVLRPHYGAFLRSGRVLLTGHSHQAWPDVAREGLLQSFEDAAAHVDDKWARASAVADRVRRGVAERIGGTADDVALGQSTHDLVARFLSALDLRSRPHLVTTGGEFHSLRRLLRRLAEAGLEVTVVPADPVDDLGHRLALAVRPDTAAVLASTVLYETSAVVPDLREAVASAHAVGAQVLLDAYHGFGALPFRVSDLGPDPLFVVAGGYKYAQWGEGCCFMRVPPGCALRPVLAGWFADFAALETPGIVGEVGYGPRGADRFAGATYDPASHYRAAAVLDFFDAQGLTVDRLRGSYARQTARLLEGLAGFDVRTPRGEGARGAFVAVRLPDARSVAARLRDEGVLVDARGDLLRLGPAPYVTDAEIDRGLEGLRRVTGR